MDKKLAEADTLHKAKEQHNAAGKNTGMSGRDLACHFLNYQIVFTYDIQFQFNPEWFEDEEEEDYWDISQYRCTQEEEYAELWGSEWQLSNLSPDDTRIFNACLNTSSP